jgi:DNA polymerase III alpha subunit
MPDIDIDFPHNQRNKIFSKIFSKWSNVVRISNYVTYKDKGAIKKALKEMGIVGKLEKSKCNLNYFKDKEKKKELSKKVKDIKGKFKNYSLHCGGIIFFSNLSDMSKYKIIDRQILLDKVDVESEGFFKIDILANRGLSQLVKIDSKPIDKYDFNDIKTIELLQSGNNIGITFGESPAMRKIFSTLKPKTVLDIAKCLALIRPGSTSEQADTIEDLDGDIIFDDDAIQYIQNLLNCSESCADNIRRIYSKGNSLQIGKLELELFDTNPELDIDLIGKKLLNLRKYTFCKSHALSYAYLVWALAYHKATNPKEFWKSTIKNSHGMYRKWVATSSIKLDIS